MTGNVSHPVIGRGDLDQELRAVGSALLGSGPQDLLLRDTLFRNDELPLPSGAIVDLFPRGDGGPGARPERRVAEAP